MIDGIFEKFLHYGLPALGAIVQYLILRRLARLLARVEGTSIYRQFLNEISSDVRWFSTALFWLILAASAIDSLIPQYLGLALRVAAIVAAVFVAVCAIALLQIWAAATVAKVEGGISTEYSDRDKKAIRILVPLAAQSLKAVVYVVALATIIGLLGIDLSGAFQATLLGTALIGLAAQSTLTDLLYCVRIFFDRLFTLDDWLEIDGLSGRVVAITWSSTILEDNAGQKIVIANRLLTKFVVRHNS